MKYVPIPTLLLTFLVTFTSGCVRYSNLSDYKAELKQYYDSGKYDHEISQVMKKATSYLKQRVENSQTNCAVVLDIDDTALSDWPFTQDMYFGYNKQSFEQWALAANAPAIRAVLEFTKFAKQSNVKVYFVSSRDEKLRQATEQNLGAVGYSDWDGVIMRPSEGTKMSTADFKAASRQKLEEQGLKIVVNVGDQESDLTGGAAEKTFKLPNPFYRVAW